MVVGRAAGIVTSGADVALGEGGAVILAGLVVGGAAGILVGAATRARAHVAGSRVEVASIQALLVVRSALSAAAGSWAGVGRAGRFVAGAVFTNGVASVAALSRAVAGRKTAVAGAVGLAFVAACLVGAVEASGHGLVTVVEAGSVTSRAAEGVRRADGAQREPTVSHASLVCAAGRVGGAGRAQRETAVVHTSLICAAGRVGGAYGACVGNARATHVWGPEGTNVAGTRRQTHADASVIIEAWLAVGIIGPEAAILWLVTCFSQGGILDGWNICIGRVKVQQAGTSKRVEGSRCENVGRLTCINAISIITCLPCVNINPEGIEDCDSYLKKYKNVVRKL